jgi:hypothetical protein
MIQGGKKFEKTNKSKFKKFDEAREQLKAKKKHHDKSTYRLMREEEKEILV